MEKNEILRIYGTNYKEMTLQLLAQADLAACIPQGAKRIGIKPNLVTPTPASYGATTHPEIIAGIIEYLQSCGQYEITIAEGSWVGDKTSEAFDYCGYHALSEQYGVRLLDTQKDSSFRADCKGVSLNVNSCVKDFDFLINVPVLKGHCQTKITCALKNMKGLIPNSEKRRFHTMGLHKPIAYLNTCIHQDFIVVDHICGDLDFEEGGNPVIRNCIMAAKDPVLTDAFVCRLLGYQINDVPYVKLAEEIGIGSADLTALRLVTLSGGSAAQELAESESPDALGLEGQQAGKRLLEVSYAVDELDSCSACYGMLIPALSRLKEEGLLDDLQERIGIGQGHRGKKGRLGVGNCTCLFDHYVKGCPPTEEDIYQGLKKYILQSERQSGGRFSD